MQTMLTHRIPAVLWIQQRTQDYKLIRESAFYFESNSAKTSFTKKDPLLKDGKEPVVVVQGITIRKKVGNILPKEITFDDEFNLGDSLLMLGASHRQYPDENENSRIEDTFDNSYKEYKKKAIELKCTREDPQLFAIYHIYCDRLGNIEPIKYEVNSYLSATYGNFYRRMRAEVSDDFLKIYKKNIVLTRFLSSLKRHTYGLLTSGALSYGIKFDEAKRERKISLETL